MLFDYNKHTIEKKTKIFHLNGTYSFLQTETTILFLKFSDYNRLEEVHIVIEGF